MDIQAVLSSEFQTAPAIIGKIVSLIDEGNTIPFIARYRKEMTGAMDDQKLREISERLDYLRGLDKRREQIAASIAEQGKMTAELEKKLSAAATLSELEDIYPAASAKSKVDAAFRERAQQATFKLQSGYAPFHAIWKHIMNVSLKDLKKNYGNLNVSFDLWKGESDAQPYIPGLIEDLQKKGLAYESDGALVVDIAQEGDAKEYPPCIVRKSDGAALYATSDLATIIEREQDFHPDRYIYVVDKRQELHFTQVFRVAKKAKITRPEVGLVFIGFGTMNGKSGHRQRRYADDLLGLRYDERQGRWSVQDT